MTDRDIERALGEGELAAVLLSRSGWTRADSVAMRARFLADADGPALWAIELRNADEAAWHVIYVRAESVVGLSIRKATDADKEL